jgi:hypothetical protein
VVSVIKLDEGHRQALELLAYEHKGCTQALLMTRGVSGDTLDALVLYGMAMARPNRLRVGSRERTVVWVKITKEGLQAIAR